MNLNEIKFNYWQLSSTTPGGVVQALADIAQCIKTIVTTVQGSDPLRPFFGTRVFDYQDKPVNLAVPNATKEILDALVAFEPRAVIRRVLPVLNGSHLTVSIFWQPAQNDLLEYAPEDLENSQAVMLQLDGIGVMVIETTFEVF